MSGLRCGAVLKKEKNPKYSFLWWCVSVSTRKFRSSQPSSYMICLTYYKTPDAVLEMANPRTPPIYSALAYEYLISLPKILLKISIILARHTPSLSPTIGRSIRIPNIAPRIDFPITAALGATYCITGF